MGKKLINPLVIAPNPLYHGTSLENLRNIIKYGGLSPGKGYSPHRTITRDALFYIDNMENALAYASGDKVILEIDSNELNLEPDWDDASSVISADLTFLNEELDKLGIISGETEDLELGKPIPDNIAWDVIRFLENDFMYSIERSEPSSLRVEQFEGSYYLMADPYVCMGVDESAMHIAPDLYDDSEFSFQDGSPCLLGRQYLSKEDLDIKQISYVWLSTEALNGLRIGTNESLILNSITVNDYSTVILENEDGEELESEDIDFNKITFYAVKPLELREFLHSGQRFLWRRNPDEHLRRLEREASLGDVNAAKQLSLEKHRRGIFEEDCWQCQIIKVQNDPDWIARYEAIFALGEIGAPESIPILVNIIKNPEPGRGALCWASIEALGKVGDLSTIPVLIEVMNGRPIYTGGHTIPNGPTSSREAAVALIRVLKRNYSGPDILSAEQLVLIACSAGEYGLVIHSFGYSFTFALRTLLNKAGKNIIKLIEIVSPIPSSDGSAGAGLVVRFENGTTYTSLWSSSEILWNWLDRPVFYSVPAVWHDLTSGVSSSGRIYKGLKNSPQGTLSSEAKKRRNPSDYEVRRKPLQ